MFDEQVHTNGLQEKVVELLVQWVKSQQVPGLKVEVVKDPKCRTPVIFIEVEATQQDCGTILLYGCVKFFILQFSPCRHFDKQPPFTGWAEDLGPYTPVIKDKDGEPWFVLFFLLTKKKALRTRRSRRWLLHLLISHRYSCIEGTKHSTRKMCDFD